MFLSVTTDKRREEKPELEQPPQSSADKGGPQPSHIASWEEKKEWNARKDSVLVTRLAPGGNMWGFQCKPCMSSGRIVITEAKHDSIRQHFRVAHVGNPIQFVRVRCHEESDEQRQKPARARSSSTTEVPKRILASVGGQVQLVSDEKQLRKLIEDSPVFLNLGRMAFAEKARVGRLVSLPIAEQLRERAKRKLEVQNDARCPICLESFREAKTVVKHATTKHSTALFTSTLRCFQCGLDYPMHRGPELHAHLLAQHNISLPSAENADMLHLFTTTTNPHKHITQCRHCSYRTVSEALMSQHVCAVNRNYTQA